MLQQGWCLIQEPEALRSGFSEISVLVTHKLVSCFQMREREIEEGWVNRQTGASFILGSANCFTYIRGFVGGLLDKQFLPAPSL